MVRGASREPGGTQSVERALSLLVAFTDEHPERRVGELVQETGLGQSTVSRLVGALEAMGYLAHDTRSGLYRMGPRVIGLGSLALNQHPVFREARQPAQNLAADVGLGANVAELAGSRLVYLCHFEGRQAPRNFSMAGTTGPLHATGIGKALLSRHSLDEIAAVFEGSELIPYTPSTITTLEGFARETEKARRQGYSTEIEELAFGRACVAAPIRDRAGGVVAALSVSGPLSAINLPDRESELSRRVIEVADQISTALGFSGMT